MALIGVDDLIDKQKIRDQLGKEDSVFEVIDFFDETFVGQQLTTKIQSRFLAGMIWGSETQGIWGVDEWTDPNDVAFVLGSPTLGILGTSTLGGQLPEFELRAVVNPFNRFIDYLRNNTYVGTATTATVNTNNYTITF